MSRLRIAVIIATYNRATLLDEAIGCLLAQTRVPDEIVVVDDGSTDQTPDVLAGYGLPVKVVRQANRGLPAARNTGLRAATADLIAFLDSDDTLPPDSIERRAAYLDAHPKSAAVYGAAILTDMAGKNLGWFRRPPLPRGMIFAELACRTVFPMHAVMVRQECLQRIGFFDETLKIQLDLDYWARFGAVYCFDVIDETLAFYRVHPEMSVVTQATDMIRKGLEVRLRIFEMPAFKELSLQHKARAYTVHGTEHFLLGQTIEARTWYFRAIAATPHYLRAYVLIGLSFLGRKIFHKIASARRQMIGEAITETAFEK